jgi:hypothetical protein
MIDKIMKIAGVSSEDELLTWVEEKAKIVPIVFAVDDNQIGYARGLNINAWMSIVRQINKMIGETTI